MEKTLEGLRQALVANPTDPDLLAICGDAWAEAGDEQEARELRRRAEVCRVARVFARKLGDALDPDERFEILRRNREERRWVCHTHDYLDSNMVMASAITEVTGASEEQILEEDHIRRLWNEAWDMARAWEFWWAEVEYLEKPSRRPDRRD